MTAETDSARRLKIEELFEMKFTFTDKKVNIPNRVHAYAEKKVSKLDRFFKTEPEASMVFSVEKGRNKLEVTVRAGSTIVRVAESTSDMFVSIDAAVASIERQLRKNKKRLDKRLRPDAFDITAEQEDAYIGPLDEEGEFRIPRTKQFFFRPMTVEEAILQMNLVGHSFFAFRNADENGIFAVVYRRNDGDYGIIMDQP
jgi:putative sigma-54 modulation protein